eukprot:15258-Heterococcus_DN1.PRE.1
MAVNVLSSHGHLLAAYLEFAPYGNVMHETCSPEGASRSLKASTSCAGASRAAAEPPLSAAAHKSECEAGQAEPCWLPLLPLGSAAWL